MIEALFLAAILSVMDPAGDTFGDGSLRSPTDIVFRTPGVFDAQQFDVHDTPEFGFSLTMGLLNNPWGLPNGFSLPIIEIYLDTGEGGLEALLPGSGMRLPAGRTWNYAFRITGDSFEVFEPNPVTGEPILVNDGIGARLSVQDNTIIVTTTLERPPVFSMYGMVGGYDPFRSDGWRPALEHPSPWTFSSGTQRLPVVDVIADTVELQEQAIQLGVLPEMRSSAQNNHWLLVAGFGVLLGFVGVAGRLMVKPARPNALLPDELEPQGEADRAALEAPASVAALEAPSREGNRSPDALQRELPALPPPAPVADPSTVVIGRNGRLRRSAPAVQVNERSEEPVVAQEPLPVEAFGGAAVEKPAHQELAVPHEASDPVGDEELHNEAAEELQDRVSVGTAALELDFSEDASDPLDQGWDFWQTPGQAEKEEKGRS